MDNIFTKRMNIQVRDIIYELDDGVLEQIAIVKNLVNRMEFTDLTTDNKMLLERVLLKMKISEKLIRQILTTAAG